MFFSVVIPTYNRADVLAKTLTALFQQSVQPVDYEVIVVDDGSTDNTASVVQSFRKKNKNLIYIKQKNQGQGVARNTAIKKARGQVVLMIGDDIVPTHDFLYEHQKFHYLHPAENEAVLGFTAWHPELQITPFMNWLVNGSVVFGKFGGHQFAYEKLQGRQLADFNFFYTSNISLKTSLLKKFPFDTAFSGYGWEDIELGYRLEKWAGLKLYYNSWAVGYHYHPMEEKSLKKRMKDIGRSAWIIHRKYPELGKIPNWKKKLMLRLITLPLNVWLLALGARWWGGWWRDIYYYVLSKKYFLEGVRDGRKKYSRLVLGR